jgi:hypothetical protein
MRVLYYSAPAVASSRRGQAPVRGRDRSARFPPACRQRRPSVSGVNPAHWRSRAASHKLAWISDMMRIAKSSDSKWFSFKVLFRLPER